jgi:3-oxoacyl-[acyl-carrier protein] reductase
MGAAIAAEFEAFGASLILTGTQQNQIDRLNEKNKQSGHGNIRWMQVDFSCDKSTASFLDKIERVSPIHVLINNAGTNILSPIDQVSADSLDTLLSINLRAPLLLCKSISIGMIKQSYGRIVNVASIWSVITKPGRVMYTATKAGLAGMTKTAAIDLAPYGILVNAVSPGFVNTDLTMATLSAEEREQLSRQVPLGRFASPDEIAKVVLFLSSDLNTYITGQNLVVDGGFVCV